VAGWAFRQIIDDVLMCYPDDLELAKKFDIAKTYDSLSVYDLPPEMSVRAVEMLKVVARKILSGELRSGLLSQPYGDSKTETDYKKGLESLLLILPADR
jgi:hypothetical protein